MPAAVLSLHDPVAALRRDLATMLQKAADNAGNPRAPVHERVHELRKRFKRARAWALLLPGRTGDDACRRLRDLHHALATRRDLDATLEAIDRLRGAARERDPARAGLDRLEKFVQSRLGLDDGAVDLARAQATLRAIANAIAADSSPGNFRDITRHVATIARRSRRGMRRALASGDPHDYHRWRKWMKYHAYQLRYLAPLWPELLGVSASSAEHCASWLGESQDLELVRATLADAGLPGAAERALRALVDREQARLLRQAASSGLHLHAESPRAFGNRLEHYHRARLYQESPR